MDIFISGCGKNDNPLNDSYSSSSDTFPKGEAPTIYFYTPVDDSVNGGTKIKISASDYDGDLNKIELYIDDKLVETQNYDDTLYSYSDNPLFSDFADNLMSANEGNIEGDGVSISSSSSS